MKKSRFYIIIVLLMSVGPLSFTAGMPTVIDSDYIDQQISEFRSKFSKYTRPLKSDRDKLAFVKFAAVKGDRKAQFLLAQIYSAGWEADVDLKKAAHWMLKSAESGYTRAQLMMALYYRSGKGVKKDIQKSEKWLSKVSAHKDVKTRKMLAEMYMNPKLQDLNKAYAIYQELADLNDGKSQFMVARFYLYGKVVKKDRNTAIQWLQKSAKQNFRPARNMLEYIMYIEDIEKD